MDPDNHDIMRQLWHDNEHNNREALRELFQGDLGNLSPSFSRLHNLDQSIPSSQTMIGVANQSTTTTTTSVLASPGSSQTFEGAPPSVPRPNFQSTRTPEHQRRPPGDTRPEKNRPAKSAPIFFGGQENCSGRRTLIQTIERDANFPAFLADPVIFDFPNGSRAEAEEIWIKARPCATAASEARPGQAQAFGAPAAAAATPSQPQAWIASKGPTLFQMSRVVPLDGGPFIVNRSSAARHKKSPYQIRILEDSFAKNDFPCRDERRRLSDLTGLVDEQIRLWFQHGRNKRKKELTRNISKK